MFKITQNRKKCIGCMYCVEVAPHRWTVNLTDGKCDLVDAKEKNGLFIANIHNCELDEAKKVVEICPVKVIKL